MNQTGTWYSARSAQHEARRSSAHSPHGDILFRFPFFPYSLYIPQNSRSILILYSFISGVKSACSHSLFFTLSAGLLTIFLFIQRFVCKFKKRLDIVHLECRSKRSISQTDGKRELFA